MGPQHTFNFPHLLPTLTFPYISPYFPHTPSHFPPPPLIPLPTSPLPPPTPQQIFLLSPHLPSPSQSVVKLPCDEVSVAKLLWRSYHVAKLLATYHCRQYAFVETLHQRNVTDAVQGTGMWFDTTSSTIGRHCGACAKIEQSLQKHSLYFATHQHILLLVARAALEF